MLRPHGIINPLYLFICYHIPERTEWGAPPPPEHQKVRKGSKKLGRKGEGKEGKGKKERKRKEKKKGEM